MAAFALQWQSGVVATETISLTKPKIQKNLLTPVIKTQDSRKP